MTNQHWERCPVCEGRGSVPNGFYNANPYGSSGISTGPESCRTCFGRGVIVSPMDLSANNPEPFKGYQTRIVPGFGEQCQ